MADKEFSEWMGHVPRDRASVWYIAPILSSIMLAAAVAFIVAVVVFA